jgi:hypothetical protein
LATVVQRAPRQAREKIRGRGGRRETLSMRQMPRATISSSIISLASKRAGDFNFETLRRTSRDAQMG